MASSSDVAMTGAQPSTATGTTCDASTQTGTVEEVGPLERGIINPPLLSSTAPVPPEISESTQDGVLVAVLLGCGTDFKGRNRPPFRSTRRVAPVSVDIMVPACGTTVIFPDEANIAIVMRGLSYLLDQKFTAYANHRTNQQYFPYYAFHRHLADYESAEVTQVVSSAAPPQEKVLRLFRVNRREEWKPVREGGRLLFVRLRRDGWTYYYDPVVQEPVGVIMRNDVCLWECEEAIELLYNWLKELHAGAFPFQEALFA
ncbi:uncharacterized protein F4812DRAFT_464647 [Daldinia caldariorum]|uniref:uncharacterized protein n=1 Tax=Daldinia caldariorum TaxID=326644 RepID=UPI0020087EB8|nr:uncharacterized protein F4812DRAFT_464647 [Daldinia caldariorum]KAI1472519.1 hypothetical protein F4812DRAFT_464647 [Daldinia caldariorum]